MSLADCKSLLCLICICFVCLNVFHLPHDRSRHAGSNRLMSLNYQSERSREEVFEAGLAPNFLVHCACTYKIFMLGV